MNIIYTKNDYSFKIFLYKMDQFFSFSMTLQINSEKCSPNLTSSSLVDGGPRGNILFIEEPFASKPPRDAIKFLAWLKLLVWKWEEFCQMIKLLELFTSAGNIQLSEQQNLSPDVSVVELNARAY